MGGAIAGMHYIGMSSMRMSGHADYLHRDGGSVCRS